MITLTVEYYERYWAKESTDKKGFADLPPQRVTKEIQQIIEVMKPFVSGRVLDVGCGDGTLSDGISKLAQVTEVTGIDISNTAIEIAKSKYPHVTYRVGEVTNLPFASDAFDIVTAIEVVEHIYDTERMFQELSRVLKPNGRIIITTTDFNRLKKITIGLLFWDRYFYPTNPHIRFYSKKTLIELLHKFGFEVVYYRWNGDYFRMMPKGQIMVAKKIDANNISLANK